MTADDLLTMVLLQQAAEACEERELYLVIEPSFGSCLFDLRTFNDYEGRSVSSVCERSRSDALRTLLRDMGVEPIEWPTGQDVHDLRGRTPLTTADSSACGELFEKHGLLALLAVLGIGGWT